MIAYAADRAMNILGMASTGMSSGLTIFYDSKVEDVETGVAGFEMSVHYDKDNRLQVERMFEIGNYLLRKEGDDERFFTITEYESDTKEQRITVYAEDAGLDLLNDIATPFIADSAHNIEWYVQKYIDSTGFEIGLNTYGSAALTLAFTDEQTAKERLDEIAAAFGAELSYGFKIDGMTVMHKYVHIHKRRGNDKGARLVLNRDIDGIRISKNIHELATGLVVVGGTGNSDIPINLDGYSYDDGDFYVSGKNLYSREALKKWARFLPEAKRQETGVSAHIMRTYRSDTVSQEQLCQEAISQLKLYREAAVNYEVDIVRLPKDTALGDTVYIIDEGGKLYLQSRILKMETKVSERKKIATLGDFLIHEDGISDTISRLAAEFADMVKTRKLYTWVVYADSGDGAGITTDPDGKAYMGVSANHIQEEPDITDPTIYSWSKVQGDAGEDATILRIDSSRGVLFKNNYFSTVLTVTIQRGPLTITNASAMHAEYGAGAYLQWYWRKFDDEDWKIMLVTDSHITNDGFTLTVTPNDVDEKIVFKCELEV